MVFQKYKLYVILDLVFIGLGLLLQLIYIDRSIEITNIFKSSKNILLSLAHKVV